MFRFYGRIVSTKVRALEASDGSATIAVDSPTATSVVLRRFYFPQWALYDSAGEKVAIAPEPATRVIKFNAPRGRSVYRLENGTAPYELAGRILTLIALVVLLMIMAAEPVLRLARRPAGGRRPDIDPDAAGQRS